MYDYVFKTLRYDKSGTGWGNGDAIFRRLMTAIDRPDLGHDPQLAHNDGRVPRAGEIASRYRVALYDCLYIALAERESCEVITADRDFARFTDVRSRPALN